jgi:hypothetical protein
MAKYVAVTPQLVSHNSVDIVTLQQQLNWMIENIILPNAGSVWLYWYVIDNAHFP